MPASTEIAVTLDAAEWQFLVTILKGTGAMLSALTTLQSAMPDQFQIPITADTIVNIGALVERVERQVHFAP
jgi:hypothetical protein